MCVVVHRTVGLRISILELEMQSYGEIVHYVILKEAFLDESKSQVPCFDVSAVAVILLLAWIGSFWLSYGFQIRKS